jgi:hypothetical protein
MLYMALGNRDAVGNEGMVGGSFKVSSGDQISKLRSITSSDISRREYLHQFLRYYNPNAPKRKN